MKKRLPIIAREVKRFAGDRPGYWMQDGASVHKPEAIKQLCKDNGNTFLEDWPAHSPDMNPIENAWAILKRAMGKECLLVNNTVANRERLKTLTKQHTQRFAKRHIRNLCSIKKRYTAVIQNEGKPTKY